MKLTILIVIPFLLSVSIAYAAPGLTGVVSVVPANAIVVAAGGNIQNAVNAHPNNTAFLLKAGTFSGQTVTPKSGDKFYGENNQTILNGNGVVRAFNGQGVNAVTVSGLKFTNYAPPQQGIGILGTDAGSQDWIVENSEFYEINVGAVIVLGTRMRVTNNYIHNNWWSGIGAWNVTGAIIDHNEISYSNQAQQAPFSANSDVAGIKVAHVTNTTISNNYVHDSILTHGIWCDINCSGTVIDGNLVENNDGIGIVDEISYGAIIRNNTITNNNNPALAGFQGGGIYISTSQNDQVYNNTLSGNVGGIYADEQNRGSGNQGTYYTKNLLVHDNTVTMSSGLNGLGQTSQNQTLNLFSINHYCLSGSASLTYGSNVSVSSWQSHGQDTTASGATFTCQNYTYPTPTTYPTPYTTPYVTPYATPYVTPYTYPTPNIPTFTLGSRVKVNTPWLNVRTGPSLSSTYLGRQKKGLYGTIIGGPTVADGFTWWNINYDKSPDGWSADTYLVLASLSNIPLERPLTVGSTGADVSMLQTFLTSLGFYSNEITGYFGSVTETAVRSFQTANSLEAVGAVGPKTRELLMKLMDM